jgi:acetyl-CoA carboxylase biotin carboxyl carrier protein
MTTSDTTTRLHLSEPFDAVKPAEPAAVLNSVRESALGLLAGLDRAPQSLRIRTEGVEIELEWPEPGQVVASTAAVPAGVAAGHTEVLSPLAGTEQFITAQVVGMFYRSREPGAEPFVQPGDEVRPGQQVGIIEAMKLMIPVEADLDGQVLDALVADGTPVEYGDRLFAVEPTY